MFNNFFKKEKPLTGMSGLGGGFIRFKSGAGGAIEATGGTTYEVGDFKFHLINTSTPSPTSNFSINALHPDPTNNVIDFLVVGGGGGAGGGDNAYGGGGGGGGLIWRPAKPISGTGGPYPISVGAGGAGQPIDNSNPGNNGQNGGDTTIGSSPDPIYFIAKGGGGGAIAQAYSFGTNGSSGGSGGGGAGGGPGPKPGGSATQPSQPGDSGTYGHSGSGGSSGGGGGGGSGNGGNGPGSGGSGADGYQVPTTFLPPSVPAPMASAISPITAPSPEFRHFAAGGAGNSGATGGAGGGGDGGNSDPIGNLPDLPSAAYGVDGRGSGGGSWTSNNPHSWAGDGGDGIVLIKYKFQNY